MLKLFKVKNFKGFKDEISFDFSNTKNYNYNVNCIKNNLVNKGIVYGYNSSGKSNLGLAIFDIISHLTDFDKNSSSYKNFINAESSNDTAYFYYEFLLTDVIVKYKYTKKNQDEIIKEELFFDDKMILKYDRKNDSEITLNLQGTETLKKELGNTKLAALKYLRANFDYEDDSTLGKLFEFIDSMLLFKSAGGNNFVGFHTDGESFTKAIVKEGALEKFQTFLSDCGINYKLCIVEVNGESDLGVDFGFKKLPFVLVASTGTISLCLFFYWILEISRIKFLFIDEFDAFYHSVLSQRIVKQLLTENNNQIILTTHNSNLLSNELLRPDCYFILKDNKISSIKDLTDKEIREAHNLEKMFRAGIFND